ncbi:RluA family pseudouridine synthase [Pediococcus siamensis]|uniref:RluA family pseudouridine synthase n=1 Tax=Pediococcus siamensis TaxID=381829 RepID=UPI00399F797D
MIVKLTNSGTETMKVKAFLQANGFSHRLVSTIKKTGQLLINTKRVWPTDAIQPGEQLTIRLPKEKSDPHVPFSDQPLVVLFEDENWLVINKPAGVTSVPGPSNRTDTMVNRIKGHLKRQGSQDLVPHVITRLDRDTSGVMLIAKNKVANSLLAPQIETHTIEKRYLAVVAGQLVSAAGLIDKPLGLAADGIHREIQTTGQQAQTKYVVQKQFPQFAVVQVQLLTGRTHQIRVHFKSIGHPLVGDALYGGPLDLGLTRQALHAQTLKFMDPLTNQPHFFEAPLPEDMRRLINVQK